MFGSASVRFAQASVNFSQAVGVLYATAWGNPLLIESGDQ